MGVKKFQVNVLIDYHKNINQNNYRPPLHSLLTNLAWLYDLDYHIEEDRKHWPDDFDLSDDSLDLVYFRSTDRTPVDGKTFRKLIQSLFGQSSLSFLTANVYCMYQKNLKDFPFPLEFYRPLNYPYVEYHKDGRTSLLIHAEAVLKADGSSRGS